MNIEASWRTAECYSIAYNFQLIKLTETFRNIEFNILYNNVLHHRLVSI